MKHLLKNCDHCELLAVIVTIIVTFVIMQAALQLAVVIACTVVPLIFVHAIRLLPVGNSSGFAGMVSHV